MYTQCKIRVDTEDSDVEIIDVVWIPSKFAEIGKRIIIDKPVKRSAVVLDTYESRLRVDRKTWDNSLPSSVYDKEVH